MSGSIATLSPTCFIAVRALAPAIDSHNAIQAELSKHRFHRVRPGDTLGKIAQMYGTTVEKLCKLNKITRTSILRIGQNIQCS